MTCSILDKVKADLRKQNITDKNLEAPVSKEKEITKYVLSATKLAKSKYKVDLGNIFNIRKKDNTLKLEANIPAFDAIERSKVYELQNLQDNIQNKLQAENKNSAMEDLEIGKKSIENQPVTLEPKGLPSLEITC
jgi:hypothetical protein